MAGSAVVVAMVRFTAMDAVTVSSDSMTPTLCAGDRLLVLRAGVPNRAEVGDLVTFRDPVGDDVVLKRVVAVGGQTVEVRDAVLHVDGRPVAEAYVDRESVDGTFFGPVEVPVGSVFVMGDAREWSIDSRDYGAVARASLEGLVLARIWSSCGGEDLPLGGK